MPQSTTPSAPKPPKTYSGKMEGYIQALKGVLALTPDIEMANAFLKQQAGNALKDMVPNNTLSGELLHRCIDQRKTPFTREDLKAINPQFEILLQGMMRADARLQQIEPGKSMLWTTSEQASHLTEDIKTGTPNPRQDLGRALGNVTIQRNANGSFTLVDYFDFKSPKQLGNAATNPAYFEGPETTKKLLQAALKAHENNNEEAAQVSIGRIFCPEPDDNKQGASSIPIAITFQADEIMPPVKIPAPASAGSAPGIQQK